MSWRIWVAFGAWALASIVAIRAVTDKRGPWWRA